MSILMTRKSQRQFREEIILFAIGEMKDAADVAAIQSKIASTMKKAIPLSSLYATCANLEQKGFLAGQEESRIDGKGGRPEFFMNCRIAEKAYMLT